MEKHKTYGVLAGIVICEHGEPWIAISVRGKEVLLNPKQAVDLFNHLGEMLESLGSIEVVEDDHIEGEDRVLN